jgi:hypothetical protein
MPKRAKLLLTEDETARELGITVQQLRDIVRRFLDVEPDLPAAHGYKPSDLVLIRYFLSQISG